jgi:thiol-disulfide isomerase/thioredoxin
MDRLSAVILVVLVVALVVACDRKEPAGGDPPSRTNSARTQTGQTASVEAFCDVHGSDAQGAVFRWPELAAGTAPSAAAPSWRWVNLWATWCKPCIAEMPRLVAWRQKLAASGRRFELTFVSVDESDTDVDEFRKTHPDLPPSIRVADADKRAAWLQDLGMGDSAIPIHLFVSPANRLRCGRAGELRDKDYAMVDKLLAE